MTPDEISETAAPLAAKIMTVVLNEVTSLRAQYGATRDDCDAVLISALAGLVLGGRIQTGVDYPQMLIGALIMIGPPK
jgi:hypothetical protein